MQPNKPPVSEQHSSVLNEVSDKKTGLIMGFDIDSPTPGQKNLHVDLSNYSPTGKTNEEIKHMREAIRDTYKLTLETDPDATKTFDIIANKFPKGISWAPPLANETGAKSQHADVLEMHGALNSTEGSTSVSPDAMIKIFRRWHEEVATMPQTSSKIGNDASTSLSPDKQLAAVAGQITDEHFTPKQIALMQVMVAENANKSFSVEEKKTLENNQQASQELHRSV
jgi:hypothetical protein